MNILSIIIHIYLEFCIAVNELFALKLGQSVGLIHCLFTEGSVPLVFFCSLEIFSAAVKVVHMGVALCVNCLWRTVD